MFKQFLGIDEMRFDPDYSLFYSSYCINVKWWLIFKFFFRSKKSSSTKTFVPSIENIYTVLFPRFLFSFLRV